MAASEGVGILHDLLNYLEAEDDCSMYAKIITKKEDCRAAMRSKVEMGRASLQAMREKADKLNQEVTMKEAQLEELVKAQEATKADQEEMQSIIASLKMDQEEKRKEVARLQEQTEQYLATTQKETTNLQASKKSKEERFKIYSTIGMMEFDKHTANKGVISCNKNSGTYCSEFDFQEGTMNHLPEDQRPLFVTNSLWKMVEEASLKCGIFP